MAYTLTALITRDGKWFIVRCPELGVVTQGRSLDEAMKNIQEACHLRLDGEDPAEFPELSNERPFVTTFDLAV
ncbi:MAG: type II toxin-antitoxin system HicB family antitoxin [Dehalococcoidia bacterium]|nr:type II toxin-antitoxin system HicB family antitoxin [Dehalococcoidia bacterium]